MGRAFVPHHISDDSALGGSVIKNSLRFNSADNTYLSRSFASNGNRQTFTISCWVKKSHPTNRQVVMGQISSVGSNEDGFEFDGTQIRFYSYVGGSFVFNITTNSRYRDVNGWYHLVAVYDSPQATASNRAKVFVNGERVTDLATATYPSQNNSVGFLNTTTDELRIGNMKGNIHKLDGYMAEVNFVDGIALDPSYFGYTDFQTGKWRPKKYEGSYNTNGFHLEFKNTSVNPSYTVPTASFTNDSDTALLINNNEANGSTTFTDSSVANYTISGTGGISHSTAQSKFGTSSIIFDGSDDSLTVGGNQTLYGNLTTSSNQTYEAFVYHTANDFTYLFSSSSNQRYLGMYLDVSNGHFGFNGNYPNPYTAVRGDVTIPLNQWNHFFVQRNADGTMTVGFNGTILQNSVAEGANNSNSGTIGPLKIGSQHYYGSTHRYFFEGYMDEIRISNTPRYSAAYVDSVGDDTSGQGNNFVPNNFESTDVLTDAPTNNYPTLNPLDMGATSTSHLVFSNGNLQVKAASGVWAATRATFAVSSGKWYWEVKILSAASLRPFIGVIQSDVRLASNQTEQSNELGVAATSIAYWIGNPIIRGGANTSGSSTNVPSCTTNDIVGVALDMDNKKVYFSKNGTFFASQDPANNSGEIVAFSTSMQNATIAPAVQAYNNSDEGAINFGQQAFSYTPPTGYRKLNSNNLPVNTTPTILKPEQHFTTVTWTGDGTNNRTIPVTFRPDFVWLKARGVTYDHRLWNTLTPTHYMFSNNTSVETTTYGAFNVNDDGIRVWASVNNNNSSQDYVAWCWKAGGAAVTNNDGSIASQVSANQEAGFSILTYTATNNVSETIGHGLGAKPAMIIVKSRSVSGQDWVIYNKNLDGGNQPATHILKFTTAAEADVNDVWQDTEPTSSVFTVGTEAMVNHTAGDTYLAYCWAEIPGYSKMGSYTGNGNANGSYVHLGFKPALVIFKNTSSNEAWSMFDNKRDPDNPVEKFLRPSATNGDTSGSNDIDFLSNGIKVRTSNNPNTSGATYIYMAFADKSGVSPYGTETNAR